MFGPNKAFWVKSLRTGWMTTGLCTKDARIFARAELPWHKIRAETPESGLLAVGVLFSI
jgi:hypothetical protein